jgi:hypothetical protein
MVMGKIISFRKPRLRLSKKGKLSLSPGSMRIGGRKAGLNISRRGMSGSVRVGPVSYNTRRGASMRCLPMLLIVLAGLGGSVGWLVSRWV